MTRPGFDSYLICATPRTGSTLLCGLLKSSGVAGRPASYFNRRSLHDYAHDWRIARPRDGRIDEAYVRAALAAGTTSNGVFGGRVMAETLPELIGDLGLWSASAGGGVTSAHHAANGWAVPWALLGLVLLAVAGAVVVPLVRASRRSPRTGP